MKECARVRKNSSHPGFQEKLDAVTENEWLGEMVQSDMTTKNDNGHYTDKLKECVFALLTHNVSTSQISRGTEDFLKFALDLPCISTIQDWNIMHERKEYLDGPHSCSHG